MISKELLSKVLNLNMWKTDSLNISIDENKFYYNGIFLSDLGYQQSSEVINIYELAHRCKEWAFEKGYTIIDYIDLDSDKFWTCRAYPNGLNDRFDWEEIYQPTSTISIFRTCQWILDNLKN